MKVNVSLAVVGLIAVASVATAQVSNSKRAAHREHQSAEHSDMMMSGDMHKDMQMMNRMMVKHLGKSDAQYDARFIDMMIPHHEGAIMMARDAAKNAQHPEIKAMATKIIKDQQKEIDQLKSWRKAWYGEASANESGGH